MLTHAVPLVDNLRRQRRHPRQTGLSSGASFIDRGTLIDRIYDRTGIRLLGPNIYGYYYTPQNLCATFCTAYDVKGKVALSSQSGGIGMAIMFVTFTLLLVRSLLAGEEADCGCFGSAAPEKVSWFSIVRNLARGHRIARRFGTPMPVGYLPDLFGHVAQMPQILRNFAFNVCGCTGDQAEHPLSSYR